MYNNNFMLDRLTKQKEDIENLIKNYQNIEYIGNYAFYNTKITDFDFSNIQPFLNLYFVLRHALLMLQYNKNQLLNIHN